MTQRFFLGIILIGALSLAGCAHQHAGVLAPCNGFGKGCTKIAVNSSHFINPFYSHVKGNP